MEENVNFLKTPVLFLSSSFANVKKGNQVMPETGIKILFQVFPVGSVTVSAVYSRQILSSFAHDSSLCLSIILDFIFRLCCPGSKVCSEEGACPEWPED